MHMTDYDLNVLTDALTVAVKQYEADAKVWNECHPSMSNPFTLQAVKAQRLLDRIAGE